MWMWGTEKILWGEFYTKSFITKNKGFVPIVIFNFITGSSKEMGGGATHWTLLCCTVHVHCTRAAVKTHQNQGKLEDKCKYPTFLSFKCGMLTRPLFSLLFMHPMQHSWKLFQRSTFWFLCSGERIALGGLKTNQQGKPASPCQLNTIPNLDFATQPTVSRE